MSSVMTSRADLSRKGGRDERVRLHASVRAYMLGAPSTCAALAKQMPAYPKEFNREGVIIRMSPKKVSDLPSLDGDAPIPPEMLSRYLVVFKFGSVVFYNMDLRSARCLKLARTFTSTPLAVPMTDDYRVVVRPTLSDWATESDHIVLKRMDINNIKLSRAALAQTALEHYEQKVDGMVEIFSKLNKSTELTGDLNISKKRLFSLVAENNTLRSSSPNSVCWDAPTPRGNTRSTTSSGKDFDKISNSKTVSKTWITNSTSFRPR